MNLKSIRTGKGLSVPKLVELSGISRRTIQDIEKRGDCLVSNAIKLADALEVTLDELCRTKDEKAGNNPRLFLYTSYLSTLMILQIIVARQWHVCRIIFC